MLKVTTGVGDNVSEVKLDMVIARGMDGESGPGAAAPGELEVHTTAGWVRRRIAERNCSGKDGVVADEVSLAVARERWDGWMEGGCAEVRANVRGRRRSGSLSSFGREVREVCRVVCKDRRGRVEGAGGRGDLLESELRANWRLWTHL
jgi:hypothetical protein